MKTHRRQRGVVAVEAALLMSVTALLLLPGVLYVGRMTWHAIALHKAVYGASRLVAAVPQELLLQGGTGTQLTVMAETYVRQLTRDAGLDMQPAAGMTRVGCDNVACGAWVPRDISVDTAFRFESTMRPTGLDALPTPNVNMAIHYTVSYVP